MQKTESKKLHPSPWTNLLMGVLFVAFVIALVYLGILLYTSIRNFVASAPIPIFDNPPSVFQPVAKTPIPAPAGQASNQTTPVPPILPNPEMPERVNILLLGVDQRPGESKATRTDTMILLTVDPASKTAGMLSIPRDLWVRIPAYDIWNKITAAHLYGEINDYPGGGPALAMKTVEKELGVRPHYYVKVNFAGFEKVIDHIGGIDIYVETAINDPDFPDNNYGYDPLYIPAGQQHFDGEKALKYARVRHNAGGDYGRMARQQQVIEAVVRKVMDTNQLDTLISNAYPLWQDFQDTIQTDMPLSVMTKLIPLALEIDINNVQKLVIDNSLTSPFRAQNGAAALLLNREQVRPAIDAMFHNLPTASLAPEKTPSGIEDENAGLVIHNGTPTGSLASRTAKYLQTEGFRILQYGPADLADYDRTIIIDYTGNVHTVELLQQLLNVADEQLYYEPSPGSQIDIKIILGADYQLPTTP